MAEKNPQQSGADAPAERVPVQVSDADAVTSYANFCRVISAPEEVIIDFALNAQPLGTAPQQLKINQRIVVNYYTAKRLLAALHHTVQRYEQAFGPLETDIQKRVVK